MLVRGGGVGRFGLEGKESDGGGVGCVKGVGRVDGEGG